MLSRSQIVANALHNNTDIAEGSTTDGLPHVATSTYMNLKTRNIYRSNTELEKCYSKYIKQALSIQVQKIKNNFR